VLNSKDKPQKLTIGPSCAAFATLGAKGANYVKKILDSIFGVKDNYTKLQDAHPCSASEHSAEMTRKTCAFGEVPIFPEPKP
jgi:hypothetical protein